MAEFNRKSSKEEEKLLKKEDNKNISSFRGFGGTIAKLLLIIIFVVIVLLITRVSLEVSKLEKSIESIVPQVHQNMKQVSTKSADKILRKVEFDRKLKTEHSNLIVSKAHKYEYLRVISDAFSSLGNGDITAKQLELLHYSEDKKIKQHLENVLAFLNDNKQILSNQEIALKVSEKLKIYPKVILLDISTSQQENEKFSIKKRLSRLISIKDLNDQNMTIQSFKNKYKSKNWVFHLLENEQYELILIILSKWQAKNQLIDVFATLQLKQDLRMELLEMQKILLE